jgi:serine protease Do
MTRRLLPLLALIAVVSFLLGLVAGRPAPGDPARTAAALPHGAPAPLVITTGQSTDAEAAPIRPLGADFSAIVSRLNAAVVNVDTTASDPDERPRLVFPRRFPEDVHEGSGSGFVIDPAGFILTNYHVVNDADRVMVTLGDGRVFKASVVGVDADIDVALLQIRAGELLPVAPLGSSSKLKVGEWVCAIGNPLGYPHSVTVGVVSFLGRKVFDPGLDALIQTDAAITFGNSGGPLINARGEVVGITAAISSQAANIGFAVPIDQVVAVLPQLRDVGRVSRGDMGARVTRVTPALQRALQLGPSQGALVQDVLADMPAERAGLRAYDVIVAADDRAVESDEDLQRYISSRAPGTVTTLQVWRDGASRTVTMKLAERPPSASARALGAGATRTHQAGRDDQVLGLHVTDLDEATARRKGVPAEFGGVLISSIDSAGPARATAIREGQILLEINRQRVTSQAEYRALVSTIRPGVPVAVFVYDPVLRQRVLYSFVTDPS